MRGVATSAARGVCLAALAFAFALPSATAAPAPTAQAQADTLQKIRQANTVNIGVREASIPFSFLDEQKQPIGYSVDICLRVIDALKKEMKLPNLKVNYVPVSSANRIPAVVEGKVDMECGSTTNTADRQKQVAFAYTTFFAGIKILARKTDQINGGGGLEALSGKTVVLTRGTTADKMVRAANDERHLNMRLLAAMDHDESFRAVETGQAQAFVMDDVLLYSLMTKSGKPDFEVVGKFSVEPYAIMLRQNDAAFEKFVNGVLVNLFTSGDIFKIYDKWFNSKYIRMPMSHNLKEAFIMPNTYPAFP
jgi:glutamate/aspartate transport system substrate-binding protein